MSDKQDQQVIVQISVNPLLLGAETLGQMLGVSRKTIYNWLKDGRLGPQPMRKFGRRTLWGWPELEAWVQAGCPGREEWAAIQKTQNGVR